MKAPMLNFRPMYRGLYLLLLSLSLWFSSGLEAQEPRYYIHTALQSDTLIGIANRYLIKRNDWQAIKSVNKIENPNRIPVGTRIKIPVTLMRTELINAEVIALQGQVESSNGVLAVGSRVGEGDKLKTGSNGFVSIRLADGSILKVQSKSSIQLENARQLANTGGVGDTVVKLEQGRVETSVTKQKGSGARYEIRTPTSNMGVRGTVFRVGSDDTGRRALSEVVEGMVDVGSTGQAKILTLPAGFGTVVEAGKPPSAPISLLPAPDLSAVATVASKPQIRIQFPALALAQGYRGQVATDAAFTNLIMDVTAMLPMIDLVNLPDGQLFLRVRGFDQNGLEGIDATKSLLLKATPRPPLLLYPADNAQVSSGQARFEWVNAAEAVGYLIQIDHNAAFTTPFINKKIIARRVFTPETPLAPGQYQWRVASVRGNGDVGPFSEAQFFMVRDAAIKLDIPNIKGGDARFSWSGKPGQFYQFQLSRTERFSKIVADRVVDKTEVVIDGLAKNVYYIRVRAVDKPVVKSTDAATEYKGVWSDTVQVEIYGSIF